MPMIHQGRMESYQWQELGQEPRSLVYSSGGEHEDGGFDGALSDPGEAEMGRRQVAQMRAWKTEWQKRFKVYRMEADWLTGSR